MPKETPYARALRFLYGLDHGGPKLGLDRVEAALALLGHPERGQRFVHVAGTNGKGSVAATIASILHRAGLRAGLFTSPHLHRFAERFQIDGRPESERRLARRIAALERAMRSPGFPGLTFFEATTVLAFETFRERACDVVVLEVGLGGRLDATNVVEPLLTVITRIAIDHARQLGPTVQAIAAEKAGILAPGVPVICGVRSAGAREVIAARAAELGAPILTLGAAFGARPGRRRGTVDVDVGETCVAGLRPALEGAHQVDNLAIAVAACVTLRGRGLGIPDAAIAEGVRRVRHPGRLELIEGAPGVLLDAAHNPDGCAALASYLSARPRGRRVLVFGASSDKDHAEMLAELDGAFDAYVFAAAPIFRAEAPEALAELRPGHVARDVAEALAVARERAGEDGLVVVAGSLFLVAEARACLLGIRNEKLVSG